MTTTTQPPRYRECTWAPDDPDACPFCAGEACALCGTFPQPACEHDSLDRHRERTPYPQESTHAPHTATATA